MGSTKKMMKLPIEETQIYFNDLQQVPQVHQGNIFPAIAFTKDFAFGKKWKKNFRTRVTEAIWAQKL